MGLEESGVGGSESKTSGELWAIRLALWDLLQELRDGEVDPETAEQMVSVLDSLSELVKLEGREAAAEQQGKPDSRAATDERRP